MFTIFRHSLSRSLGTILGWGLSLAVLGGYLMPVLRYLLADQQAQLHPAIRDAISYCAVYLRFRQPVESRS